MTDTTRASSYIEQERIFRQGQVDLHRSRCLIGAPPDPFKAWHYGVDGYGRWYRNVGSTLNYAWQECDKPQWEPVMDARERH